MKTVALDQNKWIEIAQAWANQDTNPSARKKLARLVELAETGGVRFPLTHSNIYETHKINDRKRRTDLAYVQSVMSQGQVFIGRPQQRNKEVMDLLRSHFRLPSGGERPDWFLSNRFWEATAPTDTISESAAFSNKLVEWVEANPQKAIFSYLTDSEETARANAIRRYSTGIREVLDRIQSRRMHHAADSLSIRRKALGVYMFMDNQDHFWNAVGELGIPDEKFRQSDDSLKRDLVRSVPCLDIERELTLKIEAENVELTENDVRDLQFFTTTIPYADIIVAEKAFTQRVRQTNLHKKYSATITSNLSQLLTEDGHLN